MGRTVDKSLRDLRSLAADPSLGPEARVHLGRLEFLLGRLPEAAANLQQGADGTSDRFVRYLGWLTAGLALGAEGKRVEAREAFARAHTDYPAGRVAATMLAVYRFVDGGFIDAHELARTASVRRTLDRDPWLEPGSQSRFLPRYLRELKADLGAQILAADQTLRVTKEEAHPPAPAVDPAGAPAAVGAQDQRGLPTFRAVAGGVVVSVSVRSRGRVVTDLAASDFELLDNGVPQRFELADRSRLPFDVTMLLDTSDPVAMRQMGRSVVLASDQGARDILAIARSLEPLDRIRAVLINVEPHEAVPLQPAGAIQRLAASAPTFTWSSTAALYDAVASTLVEHVPPDRRGVALLFTDGLDGTSAVSGDLLKKVAQMTDINLFVARRPTVDEQLGPRGGLQGQLLLWPPNPKLIEEVALATGGEVRHPGAQESLVDVLSSFLRDLRIGYVLQYQPAGVDRHGSHRIEVRVRRPGSYEVRARRGYFGG
jgi:hypothetical protein